MQLEELSSSINKRNLQKLILEIVNNNIRSSDFEISYTSMPGYKSKILLIHSRYVYRGLDGKRFFKHDKFMDLEEYVKKGLREYVAGRSDVFWALLISLTGVIGLLIIIIPKIRSIVNKVKKMIDEDGDIVYMLMHGKNLTIPLLKTSIANNKILVFNGLALSLKIAGYYIVRLTYPDSYVSWVEALGLEQDPKIDVISEPFQTVSK